MHAWTFLAVNRARTSSPVIRVLAPLVEEFDDALEEQGADELLTIVDELEECSDQVRWPEGPQQCKEQRRFGFALFYTPLEGEKFLHIARQQRGKEHDDEPSGR